MSLIESAKFNKGKNKIYLGVPGNLVAFACKTSFERGFNGYVAFIAKTQLIEHYIKTLGAIHVGNGLMILQEQPSQALVNKYFNVQPLNT